MKALSHRARPRKRFVQAFPRRPMWFSPRRRRLSRMSRGLSSARRGRPRRGVTSTWSCHVKGRGRSGFEGLPGSRCGFAKLALRGKGSLPSGRLRIGALEECRIGREVPTRLEGRGSRIELSVDADGEAVLVDPLWVTVAPMSVIREFHTATLLQNGTALVVGNSIGPASVGVVQPGDEYLDAHRVDGH